MRREILFIIFCLFLWTPMFAQDTSENPLEVTSEMVIPGPGMGEAVADVIAINGPLILNYGPSGSFDYCYYKAISSNPQNGDVYNWSINSSDVNFEYNYDGSEVRFKFPGYGIFYLRCNNYSIKITVR